MTETRTIDPAVVEILERLTDRMAPEGSWCQGLFARTKDGIGTNSRNPLACSWCLVGAVVAETLDKRVEIIVCDELRKAIGRSVWLDSWNDIPDRTHQEVRDIIATARARYLEGT